MVFAIASPGWGSARQQPQVDCEIDYTHSITRGMTMCLMPSAMRGGMIDMTNKNRTLSTPGVLAPKSGGIGAGQTWSISGASTADLNFTSGAWSIGAWAHSGSLGTSFGSNPLVLNRSAYTSETVNTGWALGGTGAPTLGTWTAVCYNNNAAALYGLNGTTSCYVGDVFLGQTSDGSTTRRLFVNGIQEATTANSLNNLSNSSAVGPFVPATGVFDATYLALAWTREVLAVEWAWLNAEPYCFLRPRLSPSYFFNNPALVWLRMRSRAFLTR